MMGLVLSLFPGLDLLGRAFEAAGWCVVRGPDLMWGHDVRGWHAPSGYIDGIVGGPPCQSFCQFSGLIKAKGLKPRHGNLIPEFERIVGEARPSWWLMENVRKAPAPEVQGYTTESFLLSPRDLGDPQSRLRRFTFGHRLSSIRAQIHRRLPLVALESIEYEPAVTSKGAKAYERGKLASQGDSWPTAERSAEVQGFPGLPTRLRKHGAYTAKAVCQMLGNGVSRIVGISLARAINEWLDEEKKNDSNRSHD
jgi:DNA (cytosine-5)-methyltransferase 1